MCEKYSEEKNVTKLLYIYAQIYFILYNHLDVEMCSSVKCVKQAK